MRELVAMVRWSVEWDALDDMQHFASQYISRRFTNDLGERARSTSYELLENAVRYASAGGEVTYSVFVDGAGFELHVANDVVESRLALLKKRVAELSEGNVADAYKRALRKLLEPSDSGGPGGLGLLRVKHEAKVDIALASEGRRVTVIATGASTFATPTTGQHQRLAALRARPGKDR